MKRVVINLFVFLLLGIFMFQIVSAGVGIKWNQESALVPEDSNVCLTYGVYNPWPTDSYVKIQLSDSLQPVVKSQDVKVDVVSKYTYSNSSVPVKFCFQTPSVYTEDCSLFGKFLCKQDCLEPMKVYKGEVQVSEVTEAQVQSGGSGGSSTQMSISAPLALKVQCIKHARNYSLIYILVGLIALAILLWRIYKKKKGRKSKK